MEATLAAQPSKAQDEKCMFLVSGLVLEGANWAADRLELSKAMASELAAVRFAWVQRSKVRRPHGRASPSAACGRGCPRCACAAAPAGQARQSKGRDDAAPLLRTAPPPLYEGEVSKFNDS